MNDLEDIIVWRCGTWCYRHDLEEMGYLSDDYEVIQFDSPEYYCFLEVHG